jgi:hypothetical protein
MIEKNRFEQKGYGNSNRMHEITQDTKAPAQPREENSKGGYLNY